MTYEELDDYAHGLCLKLKTTGAKKIIITGLEHGKSELCVCGMDCDTGDFIVYTFDRVNRNYPGTGDLFASVLLGAILTGESFENAIKLSSNFTHKVMEHTNQFDSPVRDGVALEAFLGELAKNTAEA